MKIQKKIKAFTIIEMLIVMLLSTIVVGLTYMYFTQFQNYITNTIQKDDAYQTYNRFSMILQKDLNEAETVFSKEEFELELRHGQKEIIYWFDEEWIIRDNMEVTDTFRLLTGDLDLVALPDHNELLKSIAFDTEISKDKFISFSYMKDYPAKTLFEYYENK